MAYIKVTNEQLFSDFDVEINLRDFESYFLGDVTIDDKCHTGEFGARQFEEEHGFIICEGDEPRFDLDNSEDRDLFGLMIEENLAESYRTWDDPTEVMELDLEMAFMGSSKYVGVVDSPDNAYLLVGSDQWEQAVEIFTIRADRARDHYYQNN